MKDDKFTKSARSMYWTADDSVPYLNVDTIERIRLYISDTYPYFARCFSNKKLRFISE